MKKINLKGRLDLNKQTVAQLNANEQIIIVGGHAQYWTAVKTQAPSGTTAPRTHACHCDSRMTAPHTKGCHCDTDNTIIVTIEETK